jgi:hypothetical protein
MGDSNPLAPIIRIITYGCQHWHISFVGNFVDALKNHFFGEPIANVVLGIHIP